MGTTAEAAVRRLRKERDAGNERAAAALARFEAGAISAHAAAIEAGIRRKTVTLPDDPVAIFEALPAR